MDLVPIATDVGKLRTFGARVKAVLLMDADDVFKAMDRRRRRRFRKHPLLMHGLYIAGFLAVMGADWLTIGPTAVGVLLALGVAVGVATVVARQLRR